MWNRRFHDPYLTLRKTQSFSDNVDSDRETDSGLSGFTGGSCDGDETYSDCLSSEVRSEVGEDLNTNGLGNPFEYDRYMKFHCKELQPDEEPEDTFDGPLSISERSNPHISAPIVSRKGSTRGVRGRVRAAVATFKDKEPKATNQKNYSVLEKGRVVLYSTSLNVYRENYYNCMEIRKILQNLMIQFSDYDLFINRDYHDQLKDRIGSDKAEKVPHLFVEGQYVGDFERIVNLNEDGQLRSMLKPYRRYGVTPPCSTCGGFTVVPCQQCYGSKKSSHRNAFTDQFYALRCSNCDTNGLQQCPACTLPPKT